MRRISPPGAFYVRTHRTYACRIQHPAQISAQRRHIFAAARNNETSPRLHRISQRQHTTKPQYSIGSAGALLDTSRLSAILVGGTSWALCVVCNVPS